MCMQCKKGDKSNKTEVRLHLKLRSQIQGLGDREGDMHFETAEKLHVIGGASFWL